MMFLKFLFISILVFVSPVFPPVIIPFSYIVIWWYLLNWIDPILLSIFTVGPATISTIAIWFLYGHINNKISSLKDKKNNNRISKVESKIVNYTKSKKRLDKVNKKIIWFLESKKNVFVFFIITVFAINSAIPDIIVIWVVRKRLKLRMFICATIIWKAIVYLPIIWAGKWLLNVFGY